MSVKASGPQEVFASEVAFRQNQMGIICLRLRCNNRGLQDGFGRFVQQPQSELGALGVEPVSAADASGGVRQPAVEFPGLGEIRPVFQQHTDFKADGAIMGQLARHLAGHALSMLSVNDHTVGIGSETFA